MISSIELSKYGADLEILGESPEPNKWRDCVSIPTVGPNGELCVTHFEKRQILKGRDILHGQTPVVWSKDAGRPIVPGWAEAAGWVLYESLCAGKVPGVKKSPAHWKVWRATVNLFARGAAPARGELEAACEAVGLKSIWHPEVARRRAKADQGGMFALERSELLRLIGFEADEIAELELEIEADDLDDIDTED